MTIQAISIGYGDHVLHVPTGRTGLVTGLTISGWMVAVIGGGDFVSDANALAVIRRADGSPPKREACGNILRAFHGNDYACDRERGHDGDHTSGSGYSMVGWTGPLAPLPTTEAQRQFANALGDLGPALAKVSVGRCNSRFREELRAGIHVCEHQAGHDGPHGDEYASGNPFHWTVGGNDTVDPGAPREKPQCDWEAVVDRSADAIAAVWESAARQLGALKSTPSDDLEEANRRSRAIIANPPTYQQRLADPVAASIPLVPAFPPDYATTYRGFDERVRKIVAEMAPKARVITDRTHETEAQGAGMFYEFNFGHGVVKSGVMPFMMVEPVEDAAERIVTEALLEIGRRGTR